MQPNSTATLSSLNIDRSQFDATFQLLTPTASPNYKDVPLLALGFDAKPAHDLDAAYALAQQAVAMGKEVYFGLGAVDGAVNGQGNLLRKQGNQVRYATLWAEFDCGDGKTFVDQRAALEHLAAAMSTSLPLPPPTHIISSGGGLHCYWKLQEAVGTADFQPMLKVWFECLDALGVRYDPGAKSPSQVLRVAGTYNFKKRTPDGHISAELARPVRFMLDTGLTDERPYAWGYLTNVMTVVLGAARVELLKATHAGSRAVELDEEGNSIVEVQRFPIGWLRDELRSVNPDVPRDEWIATGFCIAGETHSSDEGHALFHEWSSGALSGQVLSSHGYDYGKAVSFWNSAVGTDKTFKSLGDGSALKRLFARAEAQLAAERMADFNARAAAFGVAGLGEAVSLGAERLPQLASGGSVPAGAAGGIEALGMVEPVMGTLMPECLKNICYDKAANVFYDFDSGLEWSDAQFNSALQQDLFKVVCDPKQRKAPAELARTVFEVPVVEGKLYRPASGMLVQKASAEGAVRRYRNSHPLRARVPVATEVTEAGAANFARLERHVLHALCGGDAEKARILMSYLMWYLAHPAELLHTMVMIAGAPGIGKSVLAAMVEACFEGDSVKQVHPKFFIEGEKFNGHLSGGVLGYIDELSASGREHRELPLAMREIVTSNNMAWHYKTRTPVQGENTRNWMILTNFPAVVTFQAGDRRTFYVRCPFASKAAMVAHMQEVDGVEYPGDAYGSALYEALTSNPAQMLLHAKLYKFPSNFGPGVTAFSTPEKLGVLSAPPNADSRSIVSILGECDSFDDAGLVGIYTGITSRMFSLPALTEALNTLTGDPTHKSKTVAYSIPPEYTRVEEFKRDGMPPVPDVSYAKRHHAIYYHSSDKAPTIDEVRAMFKATEDRKHWFDTNGRYVVAKAVASPT